MEMHVRTIFPWLGFIKGFLLMFWRKHAFINLKTFVRTQNLAFVRTYTFRMKSTDSFIHEALVFRGFRFKQLFKKYSATIQAIDKM